MRRRSEGVSGESVVIVGRREMNSGMKLPTTEHGSVKDRQEECAPELDEVRWLDGFEGVWRHTAVGREEGHEFVMFVVSFRLQVGGEAY